MGDTNPVAPVQSEVLTKTTGNSQKPKRLKQTKQHNLKNAPGDIPTSNKYDSLSSDTESDEIVDNVTQRKRKRATKTIAKQPTTELPLTKEKKNLPPPIIVTDPMDPTKSLTDIGITNFNYKIISVGTKILLDSEDDHRRLSEHLQKRKISFYTHRSNAAKTLKVVLRGLPKIPLDDLKGELMTLKVTPIKIFEMKTKSKSQHKALYLIHIDSKISSFSSLKAVKAISHTIVSWEIYINPEKPDQCNAENVPNSDMELKIASVIQCAYSAQAKNIVPKTAI